MGLFRFRRGFKVLPGIRINLSKMGISTSVGRPGATVNIRGDKVRTTVGMPGTWVSYIEQGKRKLGSGSLLLLAIVVFAVLSVFGLFG
jgi:hypothetical protein